MVPLQKGAYVAVIIACIVIVLVGTTSNLYIKNIGEQTTETKPDELPTLPIPVSGGLAGASIYGSLIFLYVRYEGLKKDYEIVSKSIERIDRNIEELSKDFKKYILEKKK